MAKILVSIPNQMWIHKFVSAVTNKILLDGKHESKIIYPTHKPYENNLHHIILDFLEGDYDFWLNIDADNPPINNPLDLVYMDKDILGFPTPVLHIAKKGERPVYWNAYDYIPEEDGYREHHQKAGIQQVDAIGTGCFLIARRVFEHPALQKGAFTRKLYSNGTVNKGNDISFCERAREAGFTIWAHYDYPCRHFKEVELVEVTQAFGEING